MALGKGLQSLIPQTKKSAAVSSDAPTGGDRVWQIPVTDIVPNPDQPRKVFSHQDLEDLVSSIKTHGILQPITVNEKASGGYELIAGERRLRAATIAGFPTVPAIVRKTTDKQRLELALIENIQRQDLNPIEEAFAYKRLVDEFDLTQEEVAKQVGKGRPTVANMLRLLDLPAPIQKALMDGTLSMSKAKALLSLKDDSERLAMFASMSGEKMSVSELNRMIERQVPPSSRKGSVRRDPNFIAQEQLLEERLGSKVTIQERGGRGRIVVEFFSLEELKRLLKELL